VADPCCGPTWKIAWGDGPTWWPGPHEKIEFKLKHEFEFGQDLEYIWRSLNLNSNLSLNFNLNFNLSPNSGNIYQFREFPSESSLSPVRVTIPV
jgi:hypothetical protein